jgi:hypothetical protein
MSESEVLRQLQTERDLYWSKIEKILDLAQTHKEAGTEIPPVEIFGAIYLSDRRATEADFKRGREIWAEIQKEPT